MKYTQTLKNNILSSTKTSSSNGMALPSKQKRYGLVFYLIPILISNLIVFILSSTKEVNTVSPLNHIRSYAEVILPIQLKTPFTPNKKVTLYSSENESRFNNIYLIKKLDVTTGFMDSTDKGSEQFIVYAPISDISRLSKQRTLEALPWNAPIFAQKKKTSKTNNPHEVHY